MSRFSKHMDTAPNSHNSKTFHILFETKKRLIPKNVCHNKKVMNWL